MAPNRSTHLVRTARGAPAPARPVLALVCCVALLVASAAAQAQWKWRDASGSIQFSDRPPPADVPDRNILQRPAATAPRPSAAPASAAAARTAAPSATAAAKPASSALDRQVEARRKAEEQERAARAKAEEERQAALRAENCSRARSALAMLDSGQRVTRMNDKGEREFLDDRQRAEEARRAREAIAAQCR